MKQNDCYIVIKRLHPSTGYVTKNNGIYNMFNMILPIFTTLYQVIYFCWNSDFYIENNIAATKSSFAATIDVSVL